MLNSNTKCCIIYPNIIIRTNFLARLHFRCHPLLQIFRGIHWYSLDILSIFTRKEKLQYFSLRLVVFIIRKTLLWASKRKKNYQNWSIEEHKNICISKKLSGRNKTKWNEKWDRTRKRLKNKKTSDFGVELDVFRPRK